MAGGRRHREGTNPVTDDGHDSKRNASPCHSSRPSWTVKAALMSQANREEYPTASAQLLRGENPKKFRKVIKSWRRRHCFGRRRQEPKS
jgi:hypothetical protein